MRSPRPQTIRPITTLIRKQHSHGENLEYTKETATPSCALIGTISCGNGPDILAVRRNALRYCDLEPYDALNVRDLICPLVYLPPPVPVPKARMLREAQSSARFDSCRLVDSRSCRRRLAEV